MYNTDLWHLYFFDVFKIFLFCPVFCIHRSFLLLLLLCECCVTLQSHFKPFCRSNKYNMQLAFVFFLLRVYCFIFFIFFQFSCMFFYFYILFLLFLKSLFSVLFIYLFISFTIGYSFSHSFCALIFFLLLLFFVVQPLSFIPFAF